VRDVRRRERRWGQAAKEWYKCTDGWPCGGETQTRTGDTTIFQGIAVSRGCSAICTARTECLDWLLIVGPRQLDRVLRVYVDHYNTERPHRALGRCPPVSTQPPPPPLPIAELERRDRLGVLLHAYHPAAA